uniref:Uncharacterized protein n=7 Tax=Aegilops tauschii subsp. strangulata TaxID=200361 RepID=A0A453R0S6_AEGTS
PVRLRCGRGRPAPACAWRRSRVPARLLGRAELAPASAWTGGPCVSGGLGGRPGGAWGGRTSLSLFLAATRCRRHRCYNLLLPTAADRARVLLLPRGLAHCRRRSPLARPLRRQAVPSRPRPPRGRLPPPPSASRSRSSRRRPRPRRPRPGRRRRLRAPPHHRQRGPQRAEDRGRGGVCGGRLDPAVLLLRLPRLLAVPVRPRHASSPPALADQVTMVPAGWGDDWKLFPSQCKYSAGAFPGGGKNASWGAQRLEML